MSRYYTSRISWQNLPSKSTPLAEANLNKMDYALYQHDIDLDNVKNSAATKQELTNKLASKANRSDITQINNALATKANKSEINSLVKTAVYNRDTYIFTLITSDGSEIPVRLYIGDELATKADKSELLQSLKQVSYNDSTGVFTFTYWNGTKFTVDLNVEKIPVSFSMSPDGIITMVTADGTKYTADIAELVNNITFDDSSEIRHITRTDSSGKKIITATLVDGSITDRKMQPNYLADITAQAHIAEDSVALSKANADASKSYAVGNTGTRQGEDTDNAKYYSELAKVSETHVEQLESNVQELHSDTVVVYGETAILKDATQDLFNNTQTEINTILANVFDNVNPAAYVDLTTGELMYQAGGKLNFIVDEVPGSATEGDLLWEVI